MSVASVHGADRVFEAMSLRVEQMPRDAATMAEVTGPFGVQNLT